MSEKDPYYTYTNYVPCEPTSTLKWSAILLVVLLGLVLGCALYGAALLAVLQGGF